MVALALERKTAVTIPEFWNGQPEQHHNYLIVLPLLDFDEHPLALLIVTGMPFFAFNQKTVHLVSVIGKWAAKVLQFKDKAADRFRLVDGIEHQQVFTERILKQNIELCFNSYEQYNLPSALAFFALPNMPCSFQDSFERLVIPIVRAGDCTAQLNLGFPNLAVLLALTPERSAQIFMDRVADHCRRELSQATSLERRLFTFDQMENSDQLWEELRSYAKADAGVTG